MHERPTVVQRMLVLMFFRFESEVPKPFQTRRTQLIFNQNVVKPKVVNKVTKKAQNSNKQLQMIALNG